MTCDRLALGQGFVLDLSALPLRLKETICGFLAYFCRRTAEGDGHDTAADAVRVDLVAGPLRAEATATVLAVDGASAYRDCESLLLFTDQFGARCERRRVEVWLDRGDGEDAEAFVRSLLPAVLLELGWWRGWVGIHAAAVCLDGVGVLLPGPSGCGKSTIFGECARQGLDLLSDDLVWVRPLEDGFELRPFPRGAPLPPAPAPTVETALLGALVFPSISANSDNRLQPLAPALALARLLASTSMLVAPQGAGERFRALARLAGAAPAFELRAGVDRQAVPPLLAATVAAARTETDGGQSKGSQSVL